jgi:hypothetical protein
LLSTILVANGRDSVNVADVLVGSNSKDKNIEQLTTFPTFEYCALTIVGTSAYVVARTAGVHAPEANNDSTDTATSVALKLSDNGMPALMMAFGANVGTRVPIGDVDMVFFFVKVIN